MLFVLVGSVSAKATAPTTPELQSGNVLDCFIAQLKLVMCLFYFHPFVMFREIACCITTPK
jgi:hypothetical protein